MLDKKVKQYVTEDKSIQFILKTPVRECLLTTVFRFLGLENCISYERTSRTLLIFMGYTRIYKLSLGGYERSVPAWKHHTKMRNLSSLENLSYLTTYGLKPT